MPLRLAILAVVIAACADSAPHPTGPAPRSPTPEARAFPGTVSVVADGLEHPWGLAFLPDGTMLVTERPGRLRRVAADGTLSAPLTGVPTVFDEGQGGLLDVAVSPTFADDRYVYLSFAEPRDGGAATAVARGRLGAAGLDETTVIWRQEPVVEGPNHFGSRLVFRPDGSLFVTVGERFDHRDQAQVMSSTLGKVVRIGADGVVPRDNPFAGKPPAAPAIWSSGHRNVQAAALQPGTNRLWTVEHGPEGGDELNHPEAGRNYGWPVISYGVNYDGTRVSDATEKPGMEQPVYYWDPVIAPSGATFYTGTAFPEWHGHLLVGSLTPGGLVRLVLENDRVALEERYRDGELDTRIRDVVQGPDGHVYLLTDRRSGKILRLAAR
ncbi:MAG TPA: PQQ-dependent sugar dehydrogenase [Candidatus Binatia bacterium]|jgi:glucose/arabinose dehydrogenase|nr:PQQ-dependent sugar dehydrogenase [Candidatus Binatia bacterium]